MSGFRSNHSLKIAAGVLLLAQFSGACAAATAQWVPLLADRERAYMHARLQVESIANPQEASRWDRSVGRSVERLNGMLSKARNGGPLLADFSEVDASHERAVKTRQAETLLQSFQQISAVRYRNAILWSPYVFLDLQYDRGGRNVAWREDFLCTASECKYSNQSFGQAFEYVYRKFRSSAVTGVAPVELLRCPECTINLSAPGAGSAQPDVTMVLEPALLDAAWCVQCTGSTDVRSSSQVAYLKAFLADLAQQYVLGTPVATAFVDSHFSGKRTIKAYDTNADGSPKALYTNAAGFAEKLLKWRSVKVLGSVGDGDTTYLYLTWSQADRVTELGELWIVPVDGTGRVFHADRGNAAATFLDDPLVLGGFRRFFAARTRFDGNAPR